MMLPLLVAVSLSTSALPDSTAARAPDGVHLSSIEKREATLLGGLELDATYKPSESPPLRLTDGLRFNLAETPMALDQGGGMSSDTRSILALLLGLFVGFGTGHLVAQDRDGFILFLVIDIAIIVLSNVFWWAFNYHGLFWGIGGLALLISHVIQGLDAYGKASGDRIIQVTREKAVMLAGAGSGLEQPVITTRTYAFSF